MKKLLLLITVLFVFSCSSSDDSDENQPPPPDPVYRLVEVVQLDADSNIYETLLYDYDVNGLLIRSTEISNGTSYISNMLTSTEWINNGTTTITDFTYENGLIILATLNELNFTLTNEYSYNSLNQLISKKQFDQGVFCCEDTFTYNSQGNISSQSNDSSSEISFYEYDNKKNPGLLIFDSSYLKIGEIGNNNIIKSYSDSSSQTVTYTYQYNDDNYPTISKTFVDGVLLRETKFTYELFTN